MAIFKFIRFLFHNTDKSLKLCSDKLIDVMKHLQLQKHLSAVASVILLLGATSCEVLDDDVEKHAKGGTEYVRLDQVARILSEVPLQKQHLQEVRTAVQASSSNGYDEEYTMRDLFADPGRGVGDDRLPAKSVASQFQSPLRELIEQHVRSCVPTRSSSSDIPDPDDFLDALVNSDLQIYWPFSDSWDGEQMPVITFDPEDGADANIGYRIIVGEDGSRSVEEVIVDEDLAHEEPVWVVNRNSDAEFTSLELLRRQDPDWGEGGGTIIVKPEAGAGVGSVTGTKVGDTFATKTADGAEKVKSLILKDFTMKRHYDSWFAGASEFFVKIGAVDDFTAATEAELRMYNPLVTDFMIVVKRNQIGIPQQVNSLLISDWNQQMSHCAFMITEDDGGTRSEWKCTALVRIKSMSYGVEINLPFNTRDDIVWRGQLSERWLSTSSGQPGSFADLELTFDLVEY